MVDALEVLRSIAHLRTGCYIFEYDNNGKGGVERVKKTEKGLWHSLDRPGQVTNLDQGIMAIKRYQCEEGRLLKNSKPEGDQTATYCGLCDRIIED